MNPVVTTYGVMDMNVIDNIMKFCDTDTIVAFGMTCKEAQLLFNFRFKQKAMVVKVLEKHLKSRPTLLKIFRDNEEMYVLKLAGSEIKLFMGDHHSREWQYKSQTRSWSYQQDLGGDKTESMYAGTAGGGLITGWLDWSKSNIMLHPFMCDCFPNTRQIWGKSPRVAGI